MLPRRVKTRRRNFQLEGHWKPAQAPRPPLSNKGGLSLRVMSQQAGSTATVLDYPDQFRRHCQCPEPSHCFIPGIQAHQPNDGLGSSSKRGHTETANEVVGLLMFRGDTVNGQKVSGFSFIVPSNTSTGPFVTESWKRALSQCGGHGFDPLRCTICFH